MNFIEATSLIDAPPGVVWAVLTDRDALLNGNLGITKLDGDIRAGGRINLTSEVSPERSFSLNVSVFEPSRIMVWSGGMPFGLFVGRRRFSLMPKSDGATQLHIREEFTGLLANIIFKSMPDLSASFEKMARGIKSLAEERAK